MYRNPVKMCVEISHVCHCIKITNYKPFVFTSKVTYHYKINLEYLDFCY